MGPRLMERVLHFVREFLDHVGQIMGGRRVANTLLSPLAAPVQHTCWAVALWRSYAELPNPIVEILFFCKRW